MTAPSLPRGRGARAALALAALALLAWGARRLLGPAVPAARAARREVVETLVVNGRVLARNKASIAAPVTAKVVAVAAEEGEAVRKGQLLVRLDDAEARALVEEARAREAQAEARLAELTSTTSRVAVESLNQARLKLEQAEKDLARIEALAADGVASSQQLDDARRAERLARSERESAALSARSTAAGGSEERRTRAALEEARSTRRVTEARLANLSVAAPADGTVLTRSVEPGDVVSPAKTLFVMALATETLLLAQPDERYLASLSVGQKARASADAFPDLSFGAEVVYVSPGVDVARGTVDVKLRVAEAPDYLRTDMTLSVEVETGRKKGALVVPLSAVRDVAKRPWVLAVSRGRAERRAVTLGMRGGDVAEVASGLSEGEWVLLPSAAAVPGVRVRPREAPAAKER